MASNRFRTVLYVAYCGRKFSDITPILTLNSLVLYSVSQKTGKVILL